MVETIKIDNTGLTNNPLDPESRNKINSLIESSPSDANATMKINKTKLGYRGILKIISSQGVFKAKACHRNLKDMFNSLISSVDTQVKTWRTNRKFDDAIDCA